VAKRYFAILEPDAGGPAPMTKDVLEVMYPKGLKTLGTRSDAILEAVSGNELSALVAVSARSGSSYNETLFLAVSYVRVIQR
jgi:hypothetical protein